MGPFTIYCLKTIQNTDVQASAIEIYVDTAAEVNDDMGCHSPSPSRVTHTKVID